MRAVFAYRFHGIGYSGNDAAVDMAFQFVSNQIDRMAEVSEINANNARNKSGERNAAESSEIQPSETETRNSNESQQKTKEGNEISGIQEKPPPSRSPSSPSPGPDPIHNIVVADDISTTAATQEPRRMGGQLGKGMVVLSDAQTDDLLEKLGLEMFEYYVEKLANWLIKKNNPSIHHYETILKWWREDGKTEGQKGDNK